MIREVIIRKSDFKAPSGWLLGNFTAKNIEVVILGGTNPEWLTKADYNKKYCKAGEKPAIEPLFKKFQTRNDVLKYTYDDTPDPMRPDGKLKQTVDPHNQRNNQMVLEVIQWWMENPKIRDIDAPDHGEDFTIEFVGKRFVKKNELLDKKFRAWSHTKNMSYAQRIDAMFHIQPNVEPHKMVNSELYNKMIEPVTGWVMQTTPLGQNKLSDLDKFLEYVEKQTDQSHMITLINKATILKDMQSKPIIEQQGDVFKLGNEILGRNIDEMLAWFKSHQREFDYISQMVGSVNLYTPESDDMADYDKAMSKIKEKLPYQDVELEALRAKVKQMHLDGKIVYPSSHVAQKPKLLEVIRKYEESMAEA